MNEVDKMKKFLSMLLAAMLMLTMLPAMAAEVINPMPDEIAALFDVPAWEDYHVMTAFDGLHEAWIYDDYLDAGLAVMTNGSLEVVCLIEPDLEGNLRITQRNYTLVTAQCDLMVEMGYGTTTQELAAPWGEKWMFELHNANGYYVAIGKFDGEWRVKTILNNATEVLSFVSSDRIGYSEGIEHEDYVELGRNMKYAYGTFDNRFAGFDITDFPKTYKEAREKLSNPPVTPTDFYTPVNLTLRAGEKYDVFAAPGRDSYRAANGKAVMSTNDWVQIFGEEDGWLLVQYDLSRDRMRFGYIDASALPRDTEVQTLRWYDLPEQSVKHDVHVTDDPLYSGVGIHDLKAGAHVKVLSSFGMWYYIETTNYYGETLRGFIPKTAIDLITWDDMKG